MELNKYIDHTLLRPDATDKNIDKLIKEANDYDFASICIAPYWVDQLPGDCLNKSIALCTVVGFPHGNISWDYKLNQMHGALNLGATEIDVVTNVGLIKSGDLESIQNEIKFLADLKKDWQKEHKSIILKYIVEIGYLTDKELFEIADLLICHEFDFIKTCTGYGPRGVTVDDIKKIKDYVQNDIKIKASGGIKTLEQAEKLIAAGADRLGTSSSVQIMQEFKNKGV